MSSSTIKEPIFVLSPLTSSIIPNIFVVFFLLSAGKMSSTGKEVAREVLPWIREYKDGSVERLLGTATVPPGLDPESGVLSKDVLIVPETNVSARLYLPKIEPGANRKLPVVVYFHGGAFIIATPAEPFYHNSINQVTSESNVLTISVDYRLAPENPLPAAYEDSWAVLRWVFSHFNGQGGDGWIRQHADFDRVFLAGDSAGANIAHHLAMRITDSGLTREMKLSGIVTINPYFWGREAIGVEVSDQVRKSMVDNWWQYICQSDKGSNDPLINPFVDGSPSLTQLAGDRMLICVSENDILRDRGVLYCEKLKSSGWGREVEIMETQGEDHVFHIFNPKCDKAVKLIKAMASFINNSHE